MEDFLKTAMLFKSGYASISNKYAFNDGKTGNVQTVELCLVLGMDVDIE